jgi:hypothetical protein
VENRTGELGKGRCGVLFCGEQEWEGGYGAREGGGDRCGEACGRLVRTAVEAWEDVVRGKMWCVDWDRGTDRERFLLHRYVGAEKAVVAKIRIRSSK